MIRPYILAETNWAAVRETKIELAILPWGATEAHNFHLPYGTDTYQCDGVCAEAARLAWDAGAKVMVLPTVPFGIQTGQLDIPFCLNMNPSTQLALLDDLLTALRGQGIEKLVIVNGHGGNEFRGIVRELTPRHDIFLCVINNWVNVLPQAEYFSDLGDHAGELETSVMTHLQPHLVRPLSEAGNGAEKKPRIAALRERWAWAPRPWTQVSDDTGIGDPALATAEKGERFVADAARKMAEFFVALAAADRHALYGD